MCHDRLMPLLLRVVENTCRLRSWRALEGDIAYHTVRLIVRISEVTASQLFFLHVVDLCFLNGVGSHCLGFLGCLTLRDCVRVHLGCTARRLRCFPQPSVIPVFRCIRSLLQDTEDLEEESKLLKAGLDLFLHLVLFRHRLTAPAQINDGEDREAAEKQAERAENLGLQTCVVVLLERLVVELGESENATNKPHLQNNSNEGVGVSSKVRARDPDPKQRKLSRLGKELTSHDLSVNQIVVREIDQSFAKEIHERQSGIDQGSDDLEILDLDSCGDQKQGVDGNPEENDKDRHHRRVKRQHTYGLLECINGIRAQVLVGDSVAKVPDRVHSSLGLVLHLVGNIPVHRNPDLVRGILEIAFRIVELFLVFVGLLPSLLHLLCSRLLPSGRCSLLSLSLGLGLGLGHC
mmetsp:Transcript_59759/g.140763  ORF Transcript_59759/g.140763 Transcript_59759/m.140763 type:complete len:405 (+) Transcript_59759:1237-2451(+)